MQLFKTGPRQTQHLGQKPQVIRTREPLETLTRGGVNIMDFKNLSFLKINPDTTLTKGPSSTVRTPNTSETGGEAGKISDWKTRKN